MVGKSKKETQGVALHPKKEEKVWEVISIATFLTVFKKILNIRNNTNPEDVEDALNEGSQSPLTIEIFHKLLLLLPPPRFVAKSTLSLLSWQLYLRTFLNSRLHSLSPSDPLIIALQDF